MQSYYCKTLETATAIRSIFEKMSEEKKTDFETGNNIPTKQNHHNKNNIENTTQTTKHTSHTTFEENKQKFMSLAPIQTATILNQFRDRARTADSPLQDTSDSLWQKQQFSDSRSQSQSHFNLVPLKLSNADQLTQNAEESTPALTTRTKPPLSYKYAHVQTPVPTKLKVEHTEVNHRFVLYQSQTHNDEPYLSHETFDIDDTRILTKPHKGTIVYCTTWPHNQHTFQNLMKHMQFQIHQIEINNEEQVQNSNSNSPTISMSPSNLTNCFRALDLSTPFQQTISQVSLSNRQADTKIRNDNDRSTKINDDQPLHHSYQSINNTPSHNGQYIDPNTNINALQATIQQMHQARIEDHSHINKLNSDINKQQREMVTNINRFNDLEKKLEEKNSQELGIQNKCKFQTETNLNDKYNPKLATNLINFIPRAILVPTDSHDRGTVIPYQLRIGTKVFFECHNKGIYKPAFIAGHAKDDYYYITFSQCNRDKKELVPRKLLHTTQEFIGISGLQLADIDRFQIVHNKITFTTRPQTLPPYATQQIFLSKYKHTEKWILKESNTIPIPLTHADYITPINSPESTPLRLNTGLSNPYSSQAGFSFNQSNLTQYGTQNTNISNIGQRSHNRNSNIPPQKNNHSVPPNNNSVPPNNNGSNNNGSNNNDTNIPNRFGSDNNIQAQATTNNHSYANNNEANNAFDPAHVISDRHNKYKRISTMYINHNDNSVGQYNLGLQGYKHQTDYERAKIEATNMTTYIINAQIYDTEEERIKSQKQIFQKVFLDCCNNQKKKHFKPPACKIRYYGEHKGTRLAEVLRNMDQWALINKVHKDDLFTTFVCEILVDKAKAYLIDNPELLELKSIPAIVKRLCGHFKMDSPFLIMQKDLLEFEHRYGETPLQMTDRFANAVKDVVEERLYCNTFIKPTYQTYRPIPVLTQTHTLYAIFWKIISPLGESLLRALAQKEGNNGKQYWDLGQLWINFTTTYNELGSHGAVSLMTKNEAWGIQANMFTDLEGKRRYKSDKHLNNNSEQYNNDYRKQTYKGNRNWKRDQGNRNWKRDQGNKNWGQDKERNTSNLYKRNSHYKQKFKDSRVSTSRYSKYPTNYTKNSYKKKYWDGKKKFDTNNHNKFQKRSNYKHSKYTDMKRNEQNKRKNRQFFEKQHLKCKACHSSECSGAKSVKYCSNGPQRDSYIKENKIQCSFCLDTTESLHSVNECPNRSNKYNKYKSKQQMHMNFLEPKSIDLFTQDCEPESDCNRYSYYSDASSFESINSEESGNESTLSSDYDGDRSCPWQS